MNNFIQYAKDWVTIKQGIEAESYSYEDKTPIQVVTDKKAELKMDGYVYQKLVEKKDVTTLFNDKTASQAWDLFAQGGGLISKRGSALSVSSLPSDYMNFSPIMRVPAVDLESTGLLTVSLPDLVAMIAPTVGMAVTAELYEGNEDFWASIRTAASPYSYPNTELFAVLVDNNGVTYVNSDLIDAVGEVISSASGGFTPISEDEKIAFHYVSNTLPFNSLYDATKDVSLQMYQHTTDILGKLHSCLDDVKSRVEAWLEDNPTEYTGGTIEVNVTQLRESLWSQNADSIDIIVKLYNEVRTLQITSVEDPTVTRDYGLMKSANLSANNNYVIFFLYSVNRAVDEGVRQPWSTPTFSANTGRNYYRKSWGGYQYEKHVAESSLYQDKFGASTWGTVQEGSEVEGLIDWEGDAWDSLTQVNRLKNATTDPELYQAYTNLALPVERGITKDPSKYPSPNENENKTVIGIFTPSTPSYIPFDFSSNPTDLPDPTPKKQETNDPSVDPSGGYYPEIDDEPNIIVPKDGGIIEGSPLPIEYIPTTGRGISHTYLLETRQQYDDFGSWLWSQLETDSATEFVKSIANIFMGEGTGCVFSLHEMFCVPAHEDTPVYIRCGWLPTTATAKRVIGRYSEINCGSLIIPEYYGNYLDYSPFTKCSIYLPFIGFVDVSADDIVGCAVNITYRIDCYTGLCVATITSAKQGYQAITYQFDGNCAVNIPVSSGRTELPKALNMGFNAITGAAIGSLEGGASGALHSRISKSNANKYTNARMQSGAIRGASGSMYKSETVQKSGSFGSSIGAMSYKKPFIVVKRPTEKEVADYEKDYGFPAHKRVLISSCKGYLRVREVEVTSTTATDEEKEMIVDALKEGIYI